MDMNDGAKYPLVIAKVMMRVTCMWPESKSLTIRFLRYFIILNLICLMLPNAHKMITNITDMAVMASTCTTLSAPIHSFVRCWVLSYHSEEFCSVLATINTEFWPADLVNSSIESSIRRGSRITTVVLLSFFLSTTLMGAWLLMGQALVLGTRVLPIESDFPFQWDASPWYELLYVWQCITHYYTISLLISGHDFFFIVLVMNCVSQFKLLKSTLLTIGTGYDKVLNKKLKRLPHYRDLGLEDDEEFELVAKCVVHHNMILDVCDKLQHTFGFMILFQFFISVAAMCFSCFVCTKFEGYFIEMLFFFIIHMIQFLFLCTVGNELIDCSTTVADGAYCSEWSNGPSARVRQGLSLLIQRAQREQCMTAMGFANLDYPNFVSVMRFSFSVYTLLSSIKEK